jgi:tetratricopeptide (TPR) repeat protein
VLAVAGFFGAWSNHFQSGFHLDDRHTIVLNPAIRSLSNIPRFFSDPRLFSSQFGHAAYQPLLSTFFAVDYALRGHSDALLFQVQNFIWFWASVGWFYLLLRLIPGGDHYSSLFGATLYGLHPLAAGTVNHAVQFGVLLGTVGLMCGLIIVMSWPQRFPADIRLGAPKVPKSEWDLIRLRSQPRVSRWYKKLRSTRVAFYMIPVFFGLLAYPATAVFAPLLAVYMLLFEHGKGVRRVLYSGVVCGVYWIAQVVITWKYGVNSRLPLVDYWLTQPLVVLRSLYFFFVPVNLNPVSVLPPVEHAWSPLAIAGYATVAGLVCLAVMLGRKPEWRAVSFGLWWFLLALAPGALVPQHEAETFPRMFFALAGLVLAVSRAALILGSGFRESRWRTALQGVGLAGALAVLTLCTMQTYRLNDAWRTDETLWQDMVAKNPNEGHSLMNFGLTELNSEDPDFFNIRLDLSYEYLRRAAGALPRDPEAQTDLALAAEQEVHEAEAEKYFQRAIQVGPNYAPAYAYYGRFLLRRQKLTQAMELARKGLQLDPTSVESWETVAETYLAQPDWKSAIQAANEILRINPDSEEGQRSLKVAQAGRASRDTAETAAAKEPSVGNYLALSVIYYNEKKYYETVRVCKEALKLDPTVAEAYVNMATAYHALGKTDEGIAALREAGRLRPDFTFIKSNIEWELEHKGQPSPMDGK